MLRLIFVFAIIAVGTVYLTQGPFYALLFYLWNAYFRPEYWVWTDYISALNLSFVIGLVLLLTSVTEFQLRFRWTGLITLILLFFAQTILSLLASEHWAWSLSYWVDFAKVLVITVLISFLAAERRRYRIVLLVIGFSLGLEQAKQGWAQLVLNPGATNNNLNPMLGDNNGIAVGMLMLIPMFVALAQTSATRWERYIHRFFIGGLVYRAFSTYSRGGLLAAIAVGSMALWWSPRRFRALISILLVAGIVVSVMPQSFWDRMQTITASDKERDASAAGRLFFWGIALRMADAKPITGVGFNGFQRSYTSYDTSHGYWGDARAVHSAWFGVLADMGYPGLVLFVAILLTGFYNTWRVRRRTARDPALRDLRAYSSAMMMSFMAYAVGVTFLSSQYLEMFWHFIGLSVALDSIFLQLTAASAPPERVAATRPVSRPTAFPRPAGVVRPVRAPSHGA